ncbi:MAG: S-layer homology domain-containing protein [Candidatus Delongbacteria bacterium]
MKKLVIMIFTASFIFFWGCSKDMRKSESVLDNPGIHISMGMKLFNDGNYVEAKKRFDDAVKIDWKEEDKAGAYAGLAMFYAQQKDEKKALKNAKKAVKLDSELPLVHTCYGRTVMLLNSEGDSDNWFEDAEEHFDEAIELSKDQRDDSSLAEAYYFKGMAAKKAYKFGKAKNAFSEVVKLKDIYSTEADEEWETVQKIERAKPGTKIGAKVALMDEVGKAEVAVLFVEEMKIEDVLDKREKKEYDNQFTAPTDPMKYQTASKDQPAANDIAGHWASDWIRIVLDKGVMGNAPDNKFYPDKEITRAEYAMMLLRVMVLITGDESLYTKHFGEENSMFVDVRTDHYAYNAMAVAASRGFMKANINGEFELNETVSGADALLTIREFQNALRLSF